MDIRVLNYFLTVCEEGTMSRAAEVLHVTQPTLSRQIADLEQELGCQLLERHSRYVAPTEKGLYLKRRAHEIVNLAAQTEAALKEDNATLEGDVYIGAGESDGMRVVADMIKRFREEYPFVRFHLHSGDASDTVERLERGLDDFAILINYPLIDRFERVRLKPTDAWGVLMRADDPLAQKEAIGPEDLVGLPVIAPEQALKTGILSPWFGKRWKKIGIVATYNLLFNAVALARNDVGYVLALDGIVSVYEGSDLAFRLLYPPMVSVIDLAWKRNAVMSNAASRFLEAMIDPTRSSSRPTSAQDEGAALP